MPDDFADPGLCPRCGSGLHAGGLVTAVRTCRECGTRYRPETAGPERGVFAAVVIGPSLIGLVVAGAGLALALNAPPKDDGAVAAGLACFGVFGTASTVGLFYGVRALGRRAAVTSEPPGPGRPVPPDRAAEVVRAIALAHNARHIVKQLDGIRADRLAHARARFARAMADDETPLVLADTSFLRNGKAGFLLTNRAFYSSRLPHPIALADVRTARHRPPDASVSLVEGGLLILHVVFPPAAILMLPLLLRRRDRMRHALLVNNRVVYTGQKNLVWGFWVEVLVALASELADRSEPGRMTVLETVHQGAEGAVVANPRFQEPAWAQVEAAIRALDGWQNAAVYLWTGSADRPVGLEIRGGAAGRYALRELPGGWVYDDPAGGDEEVEVSIGELGHRCPAYSVCTDVERVVEIARGFVTTGAFE
jgi:hypothetical protein